MTTDMEPTTKKCSKCGEVKEASSKQFGREKRNNDGLAGACRTCENKRSKAKRAANPAKELARNNRWRANNRERVQALARGRYAENPEKHRLSVKKYSERHPERVRSYKSNGVVELMDCYVRTIAAIRIGCSMKDLRLLPAEGLEGYLRVVKQEVLNKRLIKSKTQANQPHEKE